MTKVRLFKELNTLCTELDNEWAINSGGCCYVAYVLAKYLEEYNIEFSIRRYYSPTHYAVEVSDRCLNRGGFRNSYWICNISSIDLLKVYKSNKNSWNHMYDIHHNSAVHHKIKAIFRKYGK